MDNDGDWKPGASCLPRYPTQFKKTVVLFAEKFSNREAERTFGIAESNIRRWKKLKSILFSDGFVSDCPEGVSGGNVVGGNSVGRSSIEGNLVGGSNKKKKDKSNPLLPSGGTSFEDSLGAQEVIDHFEKTNDSEGQESVKEMSQKQEDKSDSDNEEVCLRWNSHHHNMKSMFPMLLQREQFVDVTLTSGGKVIKCHKLILSSCSTYFEKMLAEVPPNQHAIIFLNTIPFWLLKIIVDFMYTGEVFIDQNKLQDLLSVAEILQIKGLTGKSKEKEDKEKESQQIEQSQKVQNSQNAKATSSQNVTANFNSHKTNVQNELNSSSNQNSTQFVSRTSTGNQQKPKIDVKQTIKDGFECKPETSENKCLTIKRQEIKQHPQHQRQLSQKEQQHQDQMQQNVKIKVIKLQPNDTMPLLKPVYMDDSNESGSNTSGSNKKDSSPKKTPPVLKKTVRKRKSFEQDLTPPILYRKGTKSRPQVKVPRYYHNENYDHDDLKALRGRSIVSNENVDKKDKCKKDTTFKSDAKKDDKSDDKSGDKIGEKLDINFDISDKNLSKLDDTIALECSLDNVKMECLDVDDTEVIFSEISEDDVQSMEEYQK